MTAGSASVSGETTGDAATAQHDHGSAEDAAMCGCDPTAPMPAGGRVVPYPIDQLRNELHQARTSQQGGYSDAFGRASDVAERAIAAVRDRVAEVTRLRDALARVKAIHSKESDEDDNAWCRYCARISDGDVHSWPCPTALAAASLSPKEDHK